MACDLSTVPLVALSADTKEYITNMLNPTKFLLSENGLPRDWRGLTCLLEVNAGHMPALKSQKDPTNYILEMIKKNKKNITIKDFQVIMEQMDRWDIIDDTQKMFENDAKKYIEQQQWVQVSTDSTDQQIDEDILTLDDAYRITRGLSKAHYDAFLLYADEDADFAEEMMQKLMREYKFKLCYNEKLIAGLFQHEAVTEIITSRCNKLVAILSPNFFNRKINKFFLSYAQALNAEEQRTKLIPCIYKKCQQKDMNKLRFLTFVDYTCRNNQYFWMKLSWSINPNASDIILEHSDIQENIEINTLPKYNTNTVQTLEEANEETSSHALQNENYVNEDNVALNTESGKKKKSFPKNITLKKWTNLIKNNQSGESQNHIITETTPHLPSLNDLSSLNLSTDDRMQSITLNAKSEKKKKSFPKIKNLKKVMNQRNLIKSNESDESQNHIITETTPHLPSLDDLSNLNSSTEDCMQSITLNEESGKKRKSFPKIKI